MLDGQDQGLGGPRELCRLDEIPDRGGRGFALGGGQPDIFVIRRGLSVWGYVNSCPHVGTPLDWVENVFLAPDKTLIQCSTHGGRFRIEDGMCVEGPCLGKRLRPASVTVVERRVVLAGHDLPSVGT